MPTRPGHSRASFLSAARSNLPSRACAITALGMPLTRISAVSARVSMPAQPDDAARFQPVVEAAGGAVVRGRRDGGMQNDAAGARPRRQVDALDVVLVGADIADMREGEGDDLPGIGGVGEDLLVAGHGGVEADLADRVCRWRRGRNPPARCRRPAPKAPSALGSSQVPVKSRRGRLWSGSWALSCVL